MFQERLKELRLEAGLTQKELAIKLNTSQQNIGFWETGKRKVNPEKLNDIAKLFNVSIDYLMGKTALKSFDDDITKAIDQSVAYQGNPISDNDKAAIKDYLEKYFEQKGE